MADPYESVTVTDFNLNPPPDDGTQTPDNEVTWSKHLTKLANPLKTAVESINTNVGAAVDKLAGGVTTVSTNYTVLASDQGKLIVSTGSGNTITTPAAATVGQPFRFAVLNAHATSGLILDGNASETVDSQAFQTIPAGHGAWVETDGSNWWTSGQSWKTADTIFTMSGMINGGAVNKDYIFMISIPFAGTITRTTMRSASGTGTGTFKIQTVPIGGAAHSITSTEASINRTTANTFSVNNNIRLTISGVSSLTDVSFSIDYTRAI